MTMLRRAVGRAGRNSAFWRRLPSELGGAKFLASLEGGLKYARTLTSDIDPELLHLARTYIQPGHTVWDIGANVGLFTFAAAGLAGASGRVVAVEPDLWLAQLLQRSARANPCAAAVTVICAAAADKAGVAEFLVAEASRAVNHLDGYGSSVTGGVRERQLVPTITLDDLLTLGRRPDVVKIDVERAEAAVLKGAQALIAGAHPTLILEVGEEHAATVTEMLTSAAYELLDASGDPIAEAQYTTVAVPAR